MNSAATTVSIFLGAVVVAVIAAWRLRTASHPSALAVAFFGVGLAVATAVICTYFVYAFTSALPARQVAAHVFIPLGVYLAVIGRALVRSDVPIVHLLFAALLGFVILWFVGLSGALLVACSFGDCL